MAMAFVSPTTAVLVVTCASRSRMPRMPPIDAMLMITPDLRASIPPMNALLVLKTPRTLTAYNRSISAPPVVTTVPTWPMPALLTRTSSAVCCDSIRLASVAIAAFIRHVERDKHRAPLVCLDRVSGTPPVRLITISEHIDLTPPPEPTCARSPRQSPIPHRSTRAVLGLSSLTMGVDCIGSGLGARGFAGSGLDWIVEIHGGLDQLFCLRVRVTVWDG